MFIFHALRKEKCLFRALNLINRKLITYDQYLEAVPGFSFEESIEKSFKISKLQKFPLDDGVTLYGIPYPMESDEPDLNLRDEIENEIFKNKDSEDKTITLVHLDPSVHLYKKKQLFGFLQEKFIYKGIVSYKSELEKENPCILKDPLECLLESVVIEYEYRMKKNNDKENKDEKKEILDTKDKNDSFEAKTELSTELYEVLCENFEMDDYLTNYEAFLHITFLKCLEQKPTYFVDIPELYLRTMMGYSFPLEKLIADYKNILKNAKNNKEITDLRVFTEIHYAPMNEIARFFYLKCFLTELMKKEKNQKINVFLRMDRFLNFQKYAEIDDLEYSWRKAFNVPIKSQQEPDEVMIEKHALMDVMFETNLWNKPYVGNPFPYISEEYQKLKEEDVKEVKKRFFVNFKKYEKIKEEFLK